MKKIIALTIVMILCCIGLAACQGPDTSALQEPSLSASTTSTNPEDGTTTDTDALETANDTDQDELLALRVESQQAAASYGGFYLLKNDRFYTLNHRPENLEHFEKGTGRLEAGTMVVLYQEVVPIDVKVKDDDAYMLMSYGNVPTPVLDSSSQVVAFSSKIIPDLELLRINLIGYSIGMDGKGGESMGGGWLWDANRRGERLSLGSEAIKNITFTDSYGRTVSDLYNLEYGAEYKATWYQGTELKEFHSVANCSFYKAASANKDIGSSEITIQGELTPNGYATYDLSGVEPGLYRVNRSGILEIK